MIFSIQVTRLEQADAVLQVGSTYIIALNINIFLCLTDFK